MVIMGWFGLAFLGLILVHMARPGLERREISAARFFKDLPPIRKGAPRWRWGSPFSSAPLYLHLPILCLAAAAALLSGLTFSTRDVKAMGMWLLVDVSASMSASRDGVERMAAARVEALRAIDRAGEVGKRAGLRIHLSTFDLERRDLLVDGGPDPAGEMVGELAVRALGTDLNIPRDLVERIRNPSGSEREITHLVVVTDMPAPDWISEPGPPEIVWRDVAAPTPNVGFTDIGASRDPLTGLVKSLNARVAAFGERPSDLRLIVSDAGGEILSRERIRWRADGTWRGAFPSPGPGPCTLQISPGDAYVHDNVVVLEIPDNRSIRVDWRLDDPGPRSRMGWIADGASPHLRVASRETGEDDVPLLLVGGGYGRQGDAPGEIYDFRDRDPLLEDVNFDVVESVRMSRVSLPKDFTPVLSGADARVWAARRRHPPAIHIPGLPTGGDDNLGKLSATLFFNAVRILLRERPPAPLYTLTSPDHPEPGNGRAALHPDEGNTTRSPRSRGRIEDLAPLENVDRAAPYWPVLLMAATLLFLIERGLASFGGVKWR